MAKVRLEVARLTLTFKPKPIALVDLAFVNEGRRLAVVHGFKLMPGQAGKPWLAVPQSPRRDNPEKREDRFSWEDRELEREALAVALAACERSLAQEGRTMPSLGVEGARS